ncbi:MAG: YgcG family protein [Paludibacter sp.]
MRQGLCSLLLGLIWWPVWLQAATPVVVPELLAPVTDLTGTLSAEQVQSLDARLRAFEQRKGSQVALLLVPTTQPETIEQYSIRVVEAWKLGRKDTDDGVLLLVAKDDRAVRIEVGYGLEGVLTDATTNRIIRNLIVPAFRNGEFYQGLDAALTRITQLIDGEALPEPARSTSSRGGDLPWPLLIFVAVVGGGWLRSALGRLPAAGLTSVGVGTLVWWFMGSVLAALVAALFAFVFVIGGGGGSGWSNGRRGGWTSGPRGGWGGGFGGGGWSGGGGGFGGGGASGRW